MNTDEMIARAERILLFKGVEAFSKSPTGYRNRMDFVFFTGGIGMRDGSHDSFIDMESAELASPRVNELFGEVRSAFADVDAFDVKRKRGTYRYAVIRALDTSTISFVLNAQSDRLDDARAHIADFSKQTSAENVLITLTNKDSDVSTSSEYEVVKGSDLLEATILDAKLQVHAQGFFQNNSEMAEQMHTYIKDAIGDASGTLIDLYGGVGSFACTLGSAFEEAVVIEEHVGSAKLATENLVRNGITGEAIADDAAALARYDPQKATVITDPPRVGMSEKAALALARMQPERIVYVSCNPSIAARDLAYLRGYRIDRAAVFDMFPGTDHYEMVVVLTRITI